MVAPWDIYAERLFSLGYGYPLWAPEPSLQFGEVRIGDIGYLSEGRFHFLFNCTVPEDDPINVRGVPPGFEAMTVDVTAVEEHPNEIVQPQLRSQGLHSISMGGEANARYANASVGVRYYCSEQSGALLMLKDPGHATRLTSDRHAREYMRKHLQQWHAFATDSLGHDLQESDIIFVSGFVKTTVWAEAAFSCKSTNGELYISGGALSCSGSSLASGSFSASMCKCEQPTVFHRWGPLCRLPRGNGPKSAGHAAERDEHLDERKSDQCIFLNFFKMKQRLFRSRVVMRAAAGPHHLP
ncbi:hypothetical protein C8Q77DRAFT_1039062, partial [Trametes polyzona]